MEVTVWVNAGLVPLNGGILSLKFETAQINVSSTCLAHFQPVNVAVLFFLFFTLVKCGRDDSNKLNTACRCQTNLCDDQEWQRKYLLIYAPKSFCLHF